MVSMKTEQKVSIRRMKEALLKEVGNPFPLKITHTGGEIMVGYIRGFADSQTNILIISKTPYSIGLRILEIKDIFMVEYLGPDKALGSSEILRAKWL